jgi:hypothetical protein
MNESVRSTEARNLSPGKLVWFSEGSHNASRKAPTKDVKKRAAFRMPYIAHGFIILRGAKELKRGRAEPLSRVI